MFTRVKRKKIELLTYVMIGFVLILSLFGVINVYNSCKIINNQANTNFTYLAKSIKQSENSYFHTAETEAERSRKMLELTINAEKINKIAPSVSKYNKYKIPYIENYLNSIVTPVLLDSSKHIPGLVSTYFIFDHNLLKHKNIIGVWYTDAQLKSKFELTDNGPTSDMYEQNSPELEWFYGPKSLKRGVWSAPYIDMDIKINMITYSTPVYANKEFLGVVGVDISMDKVKNFIYGFKIYDTGKAYLIGQNNKIIFAKGYRVSQSTELIDKKLYDFLNKATTRNGINLKSEEIILLKSSSSKDLFAVTSLYNGFILVLKVPINEVYEETNKLLVFTFYLLLLAVLVVSLITIEADRYIKNINDELLHKEKLISMGTITAEIAHEINNPIGFISCNLDTLKKFIAKIKTLMTAYEKGLNNIHSNKNVQDNTIENEIECINSLKSELKTDYVIESLDELIDESKEGIKRVADIVVNLKNFAADDKQDVKSSENIEKIIEESLALLSNKIKSNVEIIKEFAEIPPLPCHKNQLEQVLINLLDNAFYSIEQKGHTNKEIRIAVYKKGQDAYIEIEDNGTGIAKNKINKIFDTFFTTKTHGEGTGLGLSIAYDIITKKHKGEIFVESKKDVGTKFIIKLPYQVIFKKNGSNLWYTTFFLLMTKKIF